MSNTDVEFRSRSPFSSSVRKIEIGRADIALGGPQTRKGGGGPDNQGRDFVQPTR